MIPHMDCSQFHIYIWYIRCHMVYMVAVQHDDDMMMIMTGGRASVDALS